MAGGFSSGGAALPKPPAPAKAGPSKSFKPGLTKMPGTNVRPATTGEKLSAGAWNKAFNQKFQANYAAKRAASPFAGMKTVGVRVPAGTPAASAPSVGSFNPQQPLVPKQGTSARVGYNAAYNSGYGAAQQAYKSPAVNYSALSPNKTLSGKALVQAAQALAGAQMNPTIQALQSSMGQNNQQTQNALALTGNYYNQLGNQMQSSANQEGQIASGLNQQLQSIGQQGQSALQGIGQQQQSYLAQYTPGTGGSNPAQSALATEIARQQGLEAQNQTGFQSFGATQGANYQGLAASQLSTGALGGQEALKSIAQAGELKNAPLSSRLAAAIGQRGALTTTDLVKLRQQEIANQVAQAGLGIKSQQAQAATTNANAHVLSSKAAAQNANTNVFKANTAAKTAAFNTSLAVGSPPWARVQAAQGKAWSQNPNAVGSPAWKNVQTAAYQRSKSAGGNAVKPLSTLENNAWISSLGKVQQLIRDGQQHGQNGNQIRQFLTDGRNPSKKSYDSTMVDAAFELLGYGAISPQTAKVMTSQMGIRIPSNIQVGQTYGGATNPTSAILNAAGAAQNLFKGF